MGKLTAVLIGLAVVAVSARAQPYVRAGSAATAFEPDRQAWLHAGLGAGYSGESGDAYLEVRKARRAGAWDTRVLGDLYKTLGTAGYGNLRILLTPSAAVHPESDVAAGLYLNAGRGWEPSIQVRRMAFPGVTAIVLTGGSGRYVGSRFYRLLVNAARTDGPVSVSAMAAVRHYSSDADYLEFVATAGREVTELAGDLRVTGQGSLGVQLNMGLAGATRIQPVLVLGRDGILGTHVTAGLQIQAGG